MEVLDAPRVPWRPIEPLSEPERIANGRFGSLDALRDEWERRLAELSSEQAAALRRQSLRRHAVETGIIERVYDVEWGLTLTLVAEGFTREVVERSGGRVDERTILTLKAQLESLELVSDVVRSERPLSWHFIRELHHAMMRVQRTYDAIDSLGELVERDLRHGEFRALPNWVSDRQGTRFDTTPPEQLASEADRLLELWNEMEKQPAVHPIVRAAWLHHRFVQLHPFEDGNGRVARALVLLVMEKHRFPPLVVDRFHREPYLDAIGSATHGDLGPFVRLLTKLEESALANELERPEEPAPKGLARQVALSLADQLRALRSRRFEQVRKATETRALALAGRIETWFYAQQEEIQQTFADMPDVKIVVGLGGLKDQQRRHWFRGQIIDSARVAGHYANFTFDVGWWSLEITIPDQLVKLRFVASLHAVGRDPGVVAVTTFGELESRADGADGSQRDALLTTRDAFRFVHTESLEGLAARAAELEALLDEGLAEAQAKLLSRVARGGG